MLPALAGRYLVLNRREKLSYNVKLSRSWNTMYDAKGIVLRAQQSGFFSDWHISPRRQYIITLSTNPGSPPRCIWKANKSSTPKCRGASRLHRDALFDSANYGLQIARSRFS